MLSYAKIVDVDHRSHAIDANFEEYTDDNLSFQNKIDEIILDLMRRNYKENFYKHLEE